MSSGSYYRQYPGPWGGWGWSQEIGCWARAREIAPGELGWDYNYNTTPPGGSQEQSSNFTPRNREADPSPSDIQESYDGVPDLTRRFQDTSFRGTRSSGNRNTYGSSVSSTSDFTSTPVADPPPRTKTPIIQFSRDNKYTPIVTRKPSTDHERKDPSFKVHESHHFEFGKVFKVLWSEPIGSGGTVITGAEQKGFQKVRRFVVVDKRNGHSICLPILTYGGQATLKKGAHPEDHAAVYSNHHKTKGPTVLKKEKMTKAAIKIEIKNPSDKLDPLSRINYAKVYTVEHNVKVLFIGQVARHYEQQVVLDYNDTHGPIPNRPSYPDARMSGEEARGDETRNAEGPDPTYQEYQDTQSLTGEYTTAPPLASQSDTEATWGASSSRYGPVVATSSIAAPLVSNYPLVSDGSTQYSPPPQDPSLYDAN